MKRVSVESSNIVEIGYYSETRVLEVQFKSGGIYQYFGVSPSVYKEMLAAKSKGGFLNQNIIKPRLPYRPVEINEPDATNEYDISIVIPTYNRRINLDNSLMSLALQTMNKDKFEVIVVDEGTAPVVSVVKKYDDMLNIKYLWRKGTTGNPGQAKNWGVDVARGTSILFVDSDVILCRKALEEYEKLVAKWPEAIICGRYDWLKPMLVTPKDIAERFDLVTSMSLPQSGPITAGPIPGTDPRWQDERILLWDFPSNLSPVSEKPFALGMFGGNLLMPRGLFLKSGGFDKNIRGHGGEDCSEGWKLQSMGGKAMFTDAPMGWHLHHERNQEENEKSVKKNIAYIEKKYHDLHILHGIIADPSVNMIYCDDGTFVSPEKMEELKKLKELKRGEEKNEG